MHVMVHLNGNVDVTGKSTLAGNITIGDSDSDINIEADPGGNNQHRRNI